MGNIAACLENVIGLSEKDCPCYESKPSRFTSANKTKSNQYIDDTQHCISLLYPTSDAGCKDNNIWDRLKTARKKGVDIFIENYLVAIGSEMTDAFTGLNGTIGEQPRKFGVLTTVNTSKTIVGIHIDPNKYKGLYIYIPNISLTLDTTGSYVVNLVNADDTATVLKKVTVSAVAGTTVTAVFDYALPLSDRGNEQKYLLYYDRSTAKPYNHKYNCNCSNKAAPDWNRHEYFYAKGFEFKVIGDITTLNPSSNYSFGLEVEYNLQCSAMDWLCEMHDSFWRHTQYGILAAKIIAKTSANWLMNDILNAVQPNPYSILKEEAIREQMQMNNMLIKDYMPILVSNSDRQLDCYTCRNAPIMRLDTINN